MPIGDDDGVRLFVSGEEITSIYQEYHATLSVFTQPSAFSITLGDGSSIKELRRRFKKNDPYELWVSDTKIATGTLDGLSFGGRAATGRFRGRDNMKRVLDGYATEEFGFQNETYFEMTLKILELAGYEDVFLATSNDIARKKFTKVDVNKTKEANEERAKQQEAALVALKLGALVLAGTPGTAGDPSQVRLPYTAKSVVRQTRKIELGTSYWQFLQEQYKKSGLFLWCDPDGSFILTDPNPYQQPSYQVIRQRGQTVNQVNVIDYQLDDGHPGMHREIICYGRTGGRKSGRVKCRGSYVDADVLADSRLAFVDKDVTSDEEALFAARRRMAEELRADFRLSYTLAGHKVLAVNAFTEGIWGPDTVVYVKDDELGIDENFYLHTVDFARSEGAGTTTTIHLMRPEDMLFAEAPS